MHYILEAHARRNLLAGLLTALLIAVFLVSGYAIYLNGIQVQRDAAFLGLSVTGTNQADATVPLFARFSIVNNSNVKMPRTRVRCAINDVDFPGIKLARNSIEIVHPQEYNSPLDAGGDGETYDCPFDSQMNNGAVVHPVCADVTMYVEYALPFEPRGYPESKSVRLVTHKESDGFRWYPQNHNIPWGQCTGVELRSPN